MNALRHLKTEFTVVVLTVVHAPLFAAIIAIQNGDTLHFYKNDQIIEAWILTPDSTITPQGTVVHTHKVKVSDNNKYFILYDEYRNSSTDSLTTTLSLYTSAKKRLWMREYSNDRRVDFERTKIYDEAVALVSTDQTFGRPMLEFIHDSKSRTLVEKDQWQRLVDFAFDPGMRYLALHVRNPYRQRTWDFIHFIDLKTNATWTYLFPICISCKRKQIDVKVDADGNTEVIYQEHHRIFNKKGSLINYFMRM